MKLKMILSNTSRRTWPAGLKAVTISLAVVIILQVRLHAGDWPMWRYNASRQASTPESLPTNLKRHWTLKLARPQAAWPPELTKLRFDVSYQPIVAGKRLFVPSMVQDSLTAYDTRTGRRLWRFFADGPVRFAPVAWKSNVYFVSDDGFLYCLRAQDGKLKWKVRGGPYQRKILGNDRLISTWPARGAPVLAVNTGVSRNNDRLGASIYFAAGIWPFMGVFVRAVDAETGEVRWTNSGSGSIYVTQQHNSPAFAGVAPQGYLAVSGDTLLVAGGNTPPAAYDRTTGQLRYFRPGDRALGKNPGGYKVMAVDDWFANGDGVYRLQDGLPLARFQVDLAADDSIFHLQKSQLVAYSRGPTIEEKVGRDRKGRRRRITEATFAKKWRRQLGVPVDTIHLKTGDRVFASDSHGGVFAFDLPARKPTGETTSQPLQPSWSAKLDDPVWTMLAADQRLFVVTEQGAIVCFGPNSNGADLSREKVVVSADESGVRNARPSEEIRRQVGTWLAEVDGEKGYALVIGAKTTGVLTEIAQQSELQVIATTPDPSACDRLRRELDGAGLYAGQVSVHCSSLSKLRPPRYVARLLVDLSPFPDQRKPGLWPSETERRQVRRLFEVLRPYGGVAVLPLSSKQHDGLVAAVKTANLAGAKVKRERNLTILRRTGALPGAAPWTHNNADVGNSLISLDQRVKAPLGLLWFGGPSHREVLPRHGHGPTPQVVGGRLFIEGPDMLRAVDVYTGKLLWQRTFPGLGLYYNNTGHHPGAGAIGGNYVSLEDGVYVAYGRKGLRLDPVTGKTVAELTLPRDSSGARPIWGYIGAYQDLLIVGSSPLAPFSRSRADDPKSAVFTQYGEGSRRIVVLNRYTGEVLWKRDAIYNFRHNAIVAGDGKLFCMDRMSGGRLKFLKRRGLHPSGKFTLYALNIRSGEVVWRTDQNVFGTWLSFSASRNLLLQAGSQFRDRAKDEVGQGMTVYKSDTGEMVWSNNKGYLGPPLLHNDTIITQGAAVDLLTGKPKSRHHPLSGVEIDWRFQRNYGCNTAIGCQNLLTFRSAAAGYFDLQRDGGTGNLGGFRSSCTSNLIPADGVLSAPDYTRTCSCSYQNQCSLALIHDPRVEMWTFNDFRSKSEEAPIRQIGINFGAPGDRRAENGVLWLEYPTVGGPSPKVKIQVEGKNLRYHRSHAAQFPEDELAWVVASGVQGAEKIEIRLSRLDDTPRRPYKVRLYFAIDPKQQLQPGLLDLTLQGKNKLKRWNIAEQLPAGRYSVVKEYSNVVLRKVLRIGLQADGDPKSNGAKAPILCGVEISQQP